MHDPAMLVASIALRPMVNSAVWLGLERLEKIELE